MDLKNFNIDDFSCKCCDKNRMEISVMQRLQDFRDLIQSPIIVRSGYRCERHNQLVGGATHSYHLRGLAIDIRILGVGGVWQMAVLAEQMRSMWGGIGIYPGSGFIHLDVRDSITRWVRYEGEYYGLREGIKACR